MFGGATANKTYSNALLVARGAETGGAVGPWTPVQASGEPPSPRHSHTAVLHDHAMWVFGGQRALHAFAEVHVFNFTTRAWAYAPARSARAPPPRFDHAAAVAANKMVVYGGRDASAAFLTDVWAFDFGSREWELVANTTAMGGRFGHSAAAPPGSSTMYVFGGYSDVGLSAELFACDVTTGYCADFSMGCTPAVVVPGFVPAGLSARLGHSLHADSARVYIYGGANLAGPVGFSEVYMFVQESCVWEAAAVVGAPVGRYDHAAWLTQRGLYVQGGKYDGEYKADTQFFPVC